MIFYKCIIILLLSNIKKILNKFIFYLPCDKIILCIIGSFSKRIIKTNRCPQKSDFFGKKSTLPTLGVDRKFKKLSKTIKHIYIQ